MKLYENPNNLNHGHWSLVMHWVGEYKKRTVDIAEIRKNGIAGPVIGYRFSYKCGDEHYSSLWERKTYTTRDAAEAAAIKRIDDETKKVKK